MSRFSGLKEDLSQPAPTAAKGGTGGSKPAEVAAGAATKPGRAPSRQGKKGILGHFSPELSRALNLLAVEEDTTLQALLGEALDLLLRNRGKHPFGER